MPYAPLQDAFISYGRADSKQFAKRLRDRLVELDYTVWFDFTDIPLGVDYQKQIDSGIEKTDNLLFIISPHSINSSYCALEIDLALQHNKRIIPLLHVERITRETWQQRHPGGTDEQWATYTAAGKHDHFENMPSAIRKINWVYFREGVDDFEASLQGLLDLLKRDQDYVHHHTVLLNRALDWERHQKQTQYLLVGEERQAAEHWLAQRFPDQQAPCIPTDLHCEFITESIKNANNLMTQVFLAHAEEDHELSQQVRRSLRRAGMTTWVHHSDIASGADFLATMRRGVEEADNVVFLMSEAALRSPYCEQELEWAIALNKRIIPLRVGTVNPDNVPPAIKNRHYIDLTDNVTESDYQDDESDLLRILREEASYYREHKVLPVKALKWERQQHNPCILLRGYELQHAIAWQKVALMHSQYGPTALQTEFIEASNRQPGNIALDVFVSYSRADADFARKLNDALLQQGKRTWFDQESIASGADFQQEIYRGIEASDNFLFVLSPRSVASPYCADEVGYAAKLNKRFVTVRYRPCKTEQLHPELAKVQWLDFHQPEFGAPFNQLVRAIDIDREHVHNHTKWLQRSLEWDQNNRDTDLLLRDSEFAIADGWRQEAEQDKKQPPLTPLQKVFITASEEAIAAQARYEKRQLWILRSLLTLVSLALLIAFGQYRRAEAQRRQAETVQESQINALSNYSASLIESEKDLAALVESIRAARQMQRQPVSDTTRDRVTANLQRALLTVRERNSFAGHQAIVSGVAVSPNGETIVTVSGSPDGTIKVWSAEGQELYTLAAAHDDRISDVVFSPDGETFLTASWDGVVKQWTVDGDELQSWQAHNDEIFGLAISPDGQTLVTSSWDATAKLWLVSDQTLQTTLEGHNDSVNSVSFSPDGQAIATSSDDRTIKIWSVDGIEQQTLTDHQTPIGRVQFSPDGQYLATAGDDIRLWNRQGKAIATFKGHTQAIPALQFSPDGQVLATGSWDKTVKLWNLQGQELQSLSGHDGWVMDIQFVPNSQTLVTASADKTLKVWQYQVSDLKKLTGHSNEVNRISFSPDGNLMATASSDQTIRLWNQDAQLLKTLTGHKEKIRAVSFSPNGELLATADMAGVIKLWDSSGKELKSFQEFENESEGQTVAAQAETDGAETDTADIGIQDIGFSPDGNILATVGTLASLWNLDGQKAALEGHEDWVWGMSFHPDDETLVTGSEDSTVSFWQFNGEPLDYTVVDDTVYQEFVVSLFLTQTVAQVKEEAQFNRENLTPNDVLQTVIDSFWQDAVDPVSLGIYRRNEDNRLVDGHTLVPTGVVQTEPGIYKVTVYDSNRSPEETYTVIFNQNENVWYYDAKGLEHAADIYRGNADSKTLDLNSLSDRDLGTEEYYECPFCGESAGIEIHLEGTNELLVSQANGSPVPDSSSFVPQSGLGFDIPPVYSLPDGQYKVEVTGDDFSDFNYVTIFGQNFVAEVELPPLANGETVTLFVSSDETGPTLVLESERKHQETAAAYIALDATENDSNSYEFELSEIELTPEQSTVIQVDTQEQYLLFGDNDRSDDTYDLSVESYSLDYLDETTDDFVQDGGFAIDFNDGITLEGQDIAVFDFGEYSDTGLLNYNEPQNDVDESQNNFLPLYVLTNPAIAQPSSQAMLSAFAGEGSTVSKPTDAEPVKNGWRRRRPRMAQRRSRGRRRRR